ncbi:MAG: helix-turn-helix transcriptional regulator [Elusimicrobia bacterium]|nr:helix-turn-helix transcriptional regulator [Elusimicrobiota bacterium]
MKQSRAFETFLKKKGIRQSEAARRLGVPHPTVWRWIEGRNDPSPLARAGIKDRIGFAWKD